MSKLSATTTYEVISDKPLTISECTLVQDQAGSYTCVDYIVLKPNDVGVCAMLSIMVSLLVGIIIGKKYAKA